MIGRELGKARLIPGARQGHLVYVHLNISDEHLGLTGEPQMLLMVQLNNKCHLQPVVLPHSQ